MTAATATTPILIRAYRDAQESIDLAIAEGDLRGEAAGLIDRRSAAQWLTGSGQGWVVVLLRRERYYQTVVANDAKDARCPDQERAENLAQLALVTAQLNGLAAATRGSDR